MEERAIKAAKKFIEYRDYEIVDRVDDVLITEKDGEVIIIQVRVEGLQNNEKPDREKLERIAVDYLKDSEPNRFVRFDVIDMEIMATDKCLIRHTHNWLNETDFYRFPEMKDISKLWVHDQIQKLKEKLKEVEDTYERLSECGSRHELGIKLIDVIHATETALRIAFTDAEVKELAEEVISNNEERGTNE